MLVYTFRTFPLIEELGELAGSVFVFSKLKEDLAILKERLAQEHPDFIVGVAATKGPSCIEPTAINKFNQGKIVAGGASALRLFVPANVPFQIATKPTSTFCNWTMYQLQNAIEQNDHKAKLMFLHLNPRDVKALSEFLVDYM